MSAATSRSPRRLASIRRAQRRRMPDLVAGFWFLASLVALSGPVLAFVLIAIDKSVGQAGAIPALIISPDSARTILGSISGSLITIASLTSSLTIVTLQLLSNQYTPRTVRGFLSTRLSQVVLGSFIAIFLYCLVLLVTVREPGDENAPFVPSLGVLVSVILAVVGLILLVVFIHSMSQTIQVSTMTARISHETDAAIARVHGAVTFTVGEAAFDLPDPATASTVHLRAVRAGFVRGLDLEYLANLLAGQRWTVRVDARPGDFVTDASVIAVVWPSGGDTEPIRRAMVEALVIAREREIRVDPLYGIRQLVDIALRALSPGINDPSTAITCLGYLRAILEDLAARELAPYRRVQREGLTIFARAHTFEDYLEPLAEVAGYASGDTRVVWSLLDSLDSVAGCANDDARRTVTCDLRDQIRAAALAQARLPRDRERLTG